MPASTPLQRNSLIREISYPLRVKLVRMLDSRGRWERLMARIPHHEDDSVARYDFLRQEEFELAGTRRNGSSTEALLRDWQHVNPTVGKLLTCLQEADLLDIANYVQEQILQAGPLKRPEVDDDRGAQFQAPAYDDPYYNAHGVPLNMHHNLPSYTPPSAGWQAGSSDGPHSLRTDPPPITAPTLPQPPLDLDEDTQRSLQQWNSRQGGRTFRYDELELWTRHFESAPLDEGGMLIGKGGYADVFLGVEKTDTSKNMLAVKRFHEQGALKFKQFRNEVDMILMDCGHENLLKIIGICYDKKICIVYEYMSEGSLDKKLHNKASPLSAKRRLGYARDIVRGLNKLHSLPQPITHRDIKTANILLKNDPPRAKIGDFGLARVMQSQTDTQTSNITEEIIGSRFYMPPEAMDFKVSPQWDVYSFGVVLLELLTGLEAAYKYPDGNVERLVSHLFDNEDADFDKMNCVDQLANWPINLAERLLVLSELCTQNKRADRPKISQVLQTLEELYRAFYPE